MENNKISVSFRLNGGLGTYIYELNYIYCFYMHFEDEVNIIVYCTNDYKVNDGIMRGLCFISDYCERKEWEQDKSDIKIDINWFPKVCYYNKNNNWSEKFVAYFNNLNKMEKDASYRNFLRIDEAYEYHIYQYCVALNKNRVNVTDFNNFLGMKDEFQIRLVCNENEEFVLEKYKLRKYITMQMGVNANTSESYSPKLWPVEYYNELCLLLKKEFPEITLVQVGEGKTTIEGVDISLLEKTSFEELKILLKNSWLHIDGECGMVHIRNALGSYPSVVLFGQTPMAIYAHKKDINISLSECGLGCSKLFNGWKRRCFKSGEEALCMRAITPKIVIERIKSWADEKIETIEQSPVDKIFAEGYRVDAEWYEQWLSKRHVHDCFLEEIPLEEINIKRLNINEYVVDRIENHPAVSYFRGDSMPYIKYMEMNDKFNPMHEHSVERLEELNKNLEANGYDSKMLIVVNGANVILDGAHRASWLFSKQGANFRVNVLKVYSS